MQVMVEGIIFIRPVALGTQGISLKLALQAVRIMAIAATHILHVHFALRE